MTNIHHKNNSITKQQTQTNKERISFKMSIFKIMFSQDNIRKMKVNPFMKDFSSFVLFLREHYDQFLTQDFLVKYQDEEGDFISVSNQIEWETMFDGLEGVGSLIYLYIQCQDEGYSDDESDTDTDSESDDDVGFFFPFVRRYESPSMFNLMRCSGHNQVSSNVFFLPRCHQVYPGYSHPPRNIFSCSRYQQQVDPHSGYEQQPKQTQERCPHSLIKFIKLNEKALELMNIEDEEHLSLAREFLEHALTLKPNDPITLYNIACIESMLSNEEEAVNQLKKAILFGYDNLNHLLQDKDFDNIKHCDGFKECISMLKGEEVNETSENYEENQRSNDETTSVYLPLPQQSESESQKEEKRNEEGEYTKTTEILNSLGIFIDEETLSKWMSQYNNDLTSVINHYFTDKYNY
eukprot:TRINITY_DN1041_c0_g1_i4.p1 TRINITY_DN1041_c0_g1~~TRINITY_DN1041_c0_g1_i4.p1  ORF type:complete len:407 (-),score=123.43 TRINITY_DN1041_c0_g1_i4:75-1295(-)